MPRLGGVELARRLRVWRPGLKVLLISTGSMSENDVADVASGARFLPKPLSPEEFTRVVREMPESQPDA